MTTDDSSSRAYWRCRRYGRCDFFEWCDGRLGSANPSPAKKARRVVLSIRFEFHPPA